MKRTPIKRKYTAEYVHKLGEELLAWLEVPANFWLGSFAVEKKMARARLQEIASTNEEFNQIYEIAKQTQENKIVLLAMEKKIDTTMAIFALKNVAGWRDKSEQTFSGELNINFFEQIIAKPFTNRILSHASSDN